MPSNEFNPEQVQTMQEDAMRRVREMHRRANERVRQSNQAMSRTSLPAARSPVSPPALAAEAPTSPTLDGTSPAPPRKSPPSHPPLNGSGGGTDSLPPNSLLSALPFFQASGTHGTPYEWNPLSVIQKMNPETMILLAMIVLLLNDGGDIKLILALCYLLF